MMYTEELFMGDRGRTVLRSYTVQRVVERQRREENEYEEQHCMQESQVNLNPTCCACMHG